MCYSLKKCRKCGLWIEWHCYQCPICGADQ